MASLFIGHLELVVWDGNLDDFLKSKVHITILVVLDNNVCFNGYNYDFCINLVSVEADTLLLQVCQQESGVRPSLCRSLCRAAVASVTMCRFTYIRVNISQLLKYFCLYIDTSSDVGLYWGNWDCPSPWTL